MTPPANKPLSSGKRPKPWWFRLIRAFVVTYLVVVILAMIFENSLIYYPSKHPEGNWTPSGLVFEDAWITTEDGVKIHGWYVPCEQPQAYILFAHGNAGNITDRVELMRELHRRSRVATLFFDFRGYGRSEGSPNEAGILADARAARKWLFERAKITEKDFTESDIILMGESLGGGVAVDLAAKDGARALIIENTFTSLPDVAARHFRFLPTKLLMRNRLNSLAKIGDFHGPLLQFHGDADQVVAYELGQTLFVAANEPKQFVTISGGDHNDGHTMLFYQTVDSFLNNLPKAKE